MSNKMALKRPRMCKKANMYLAMTIGVSIMKEIEKKSFQKGTYVFHMPFGEFNVIVVREPSSQ